MSAITAKASRKMKKYAVLTREPRCFLGSFDFSWEQRKVQGVADRFDNLRIPVAANLRVHGTTPYYGANGIQDYVEGFTHDGEFVLVAEDGANDLKNYPVKCVNGRIWVNNHAHVLQGKAGIADNSFLAFAISQSDIESLLVGGGRAKLNAETLMSIEFRLPCLQEQYRIGEYLTQLNHLITLYQRKCVFLFGFFQAFISMIFTASTFSWEQRKLGDIADIVGGGTPSTGNQSYWDGDIDWYAPAEIADQIYANSSQKKITGFGYENSSAKMLPPGTVLFTSRAGIGKTAILTRKGCTNQGFQSIVPHRGELDSYFIFSRTEELKRYGELVGAGSTFVEVSGKQMAVMELMMPPTMREQQTIGGFFQQLDHLITLHQRECISFTARAGRLILTANKKRNTSSWEQRKFSDITFPAGEKNKDNLPLESYSITNEHGFVPQDEKFENGGTMREADKRMYYIVSPNSFAYNPARINVGSIGYQNIGKNVIVSSLYEVFKTSEDVDDRLLWHWFKSPDFQKLIMQLQEGGVRLYFYYDKLCMGEVSLPSLEEQRKIGKLFDTLDNLITLHQRKPFIMTWRTSDANRNQTNRLVL